MGANQSVDLLVGQQFEETSFNLRNDTHLVREINDDLYGESQLMQYKDSLSHPYLILKQRVVASKSEYEEYIKEPQKRKSIRSPYVIPLLNIYQVKHSDYCSKYYKIYMLYAYCEKTLFDAMIEYNERQQTFTEADVLQMIENVLQGLICLKENGYSHDTIKASTIAIATDSAQQNALGISEYLSGSIKKINNTTQSAAQAHTAQQEMVGLEAFNNPNVKYMIGDAKFLHNGKDAYTSAILGDAQDFYLSPQLFNRLKHRYMQGFNPLNSEEQHSNEVSQVFSLGMVAIEMATLKSARKIYDFDYFSLNKGRLMNKLEVISQLYSPQLAFIIAKMLSFSEKERLTFGQALNLIHSYQQNPQQFYDINFNPEIILENYTPNNTEVDVQPTHSQQVIKTLEDEQDSDKIKRAQKNQGNPSDKEQKGLSETKELYSFKSPTQHLADRTMDVGNQIHIIPSSTKNEDFFNKSRSKSPSAVPPKENPFKGFVTPNKFNNNTPGQLSSSQHMRGLSTALHNQNSLSSQKNNIDSNQKYPISEYQQPYQNNQSDSQVRFHRDELQNGPHSIAYLQNSNKSGKGMPSQILQSQKLSNQSSKQPSQQLIHYEQPDFKLEKEYDNGIYGNTANYSRMKPTDPIDNKKYSHSYSQSLIASSLNNTVKAQGNPHNSQSLKQEIKQTNTIKDPIRQSNIDHIRQSSVSQNPYSRNLSDIQSEGNNIQISKKLPNNNNNQFYPSSIEQFPQNDSYQYARRSQTPNSDNIDFEQINRNLKMNPNASLTPKQNYQKAEVVEKYQPNINLRSESLIGSNKQIDTSQNHAQKYSMKFSPKNISSSQQSPNFFNNSNPSSQLKRAGPPSKSVHVSNPSSQQNQSLLQSDQQVRSKQPSITSQRPSNSNQLQIPNQGHYYFRSPSSQPSHHVSQQRNEDSVSIQVPNEIDLQNQEYPQQKIYNFDAKTISDTKNRQLFTPQQSQYLKYNNDYQEEPNRDVSNHSKQPYVYHQSQNSREQSVHLQSVTPPEDSHKIVDSNNSNYIKSIGQSNLINNNHNSNHPQMNNGNNAYPQQQQKQSYLPNQSLKTFNPDLPSQSFMRNQYSNNNPNFIQSASSLAIAHNLGNGGQQIDYSNSIKEQPFTQPPNQNLYSLLQEKQKDKHNYNFNRTDPIDIKSIIKEKESENYLDNSLIHQNLSINGPPTPRQSIRGGKNMYKLYQKSPNREDLNYKLEKVSIPEEEYNKNIQQTIIELEQKIKDFDSRIAKSKLGGSQMGSTDIHLKSQEEERQSVFQKFLNSMSCKTNTVAPESEGNAPAPKQKTPLKHLFTDNRISPERYPLIDEDQFQPNESRNNLSYSKQSPNHFSNSRQNSQYNGSQQFNQRQNIHSSKSPVQNSRDMKAFFQNTNPFFENQ